MVKVESNSEWEMVESSLAWPAVAATLADMGTVANFARRRCFVVTIV